MNHEETLRRLTAEAEELLVRMVAAQLASRRTGEFFVIRTFGGDSLVFGGDRAFSQPVNLTALNDLDQLGAIRRLRVDRHGNPVYDIGPDGREMNKLIMAKRGASIDVTESKVRTMIESDEFAAAYPAAAQHLQAATELMWSGSVTDNVVADLGQHLRSALVAITGSLDEAELNPEQITETLRAWQKRRRDKRQSVFSLIELARSVEALTNRLVHIRREASRGQPLEGWHELRRGVFLTSVWCYEMTELAAGR